MTSDSRLWNQIVRAVRTIYAAEPPCDQLSDSVLAAYVAQAPSEQVPNDVRRAVEQHLPHCTVCERLVQDLVDVRAQLVQTDMGAWQEPVTPFDLSFLPAPPALKSVPRRVLDACAAGAVWVEDQQQALWINLAARAAGPSNPSYAAATKGSIKTSNSALSQDQAPLLQLVVGAEETSNFDVEVIVRQETDPHLCTLMVQAVVPSRWPVVGGLEVALHDGVQLRSKQTGEDGQAIFEGIPIGDLPQTFVRVKA